MKRGLILGGAALWLALGIPATAQQPPQHPLPIPTEAPPVPTAAPVPDAPPVPQAAPQSPDPEVPAPATRPPPGAVDITADEAFEWHENNLAVVARGNVVAVRGDVTLRADTVTAYYRKAAGGGNEIYRLAADGNVEIRSAKQQQAYGQRGVYDVDKEVAVLTGGDLRLITENDVVTAKDTLEYWRKESLMVARGDAVAVRGDNRVRADRLVGLLTENQQGQLDLTRVDAQGGVVISTPKEVARGATGTYDIRSRLATLTGDVKVTRGQSQLNGNAAEVNLETGVSRMLAGPGATAKGRGDGRVRGLFVPGQDIQSGTKSTPAQKPAPKPGQTPEVKKP
ncbi:MAG TPA: LptA/OstA family protein [Azospirillaceae bacterium]|nr:LptA/OstA family protein [Azospirillaceae bacterium]